MGKMDMPLRAISPVHKARINSTASLTRDCRTVNSGHRPIAENSLSASPASHGVESRVLGCDGALGQFGTRILFRSGLPSEFSCSRLHKSLGEQALCQQIIKSVEVVDSWCRSEILRLSQKGRATQPSIRLTGLGAAANHFGAFRIDAFAGPEDLWFRSPRRLRSAPRENL
jgi:hypothetical protein